MGGLSCPPHKKLILCGTGILPVLENGARFKAVSIALLNKAFMGGLSCPPHKKLILCGTGKMPVLENSARCKAVSIALASG
jgi:hypothetical protein